MKEIINKIRKLPRFTSPRGTLYPAQDGELVEVGSVIDILNANKKEISDGYHTFNELYYHRMMLFAVICKTYRDRAWKSWKHYDGTMFEGMFIVGIQTDEGHYTYHYHKEYWDLFGVKEVEIAPEWDGHKPEDITRLLSLV